MNWLNSLSDLETWLGLGVRGKKIDELVELPVRSRNASTVNYARRYSLPVRALRRDPEESKKAQLLGKSKQSEPSHQLAAKNL